MSLEMSLQTKFSIVSHHHVALYLFSQCFITFQCFYHYIFGVLPIERAFIEGDNVFVQLPILFSSFSQLSHSSSLCLGTSPVAASPSGEVDAGTGGCCWSLHRQVLHQHQGCEKHSGIFSDHEWSHLWFFSGSKCLQGSALPVQPCQE